MTTKIKFVVRDRNGNYLNSYKKSNQAIEERARINRVHPNFDAYVIVEAEDYNE